MRSFPVGATLFVNGVDHGVLPREGKRITLPWDEGERVFFQLCMPDYNPVSTSYTQAQITDQIAEEGLQFQLQQVRY